MDAEYDGTIIVFLMGYEEFIYNQLINGLKKSTSSFLHVQLEVEKEVIIEHLQEREPLLFEWVTSKIEYIITSFKKVPKKEKLNNRELFSAEVTDLLLIRAKNDS